MTLYEIIEGIEQAYDACYDEETGEISEAAYALLEDLEAKKEEKVENIGCLIKNLRAEAEAVKAEKLALQKRQSRLENKAEWFKEYLSRCLVEDYAEGKKKWSFPRVELGFRSSESVVIDDLDALDDEFVAIKREPAKTAIKRAIKDGISVDGAHLEQNINLQIK